MLPKDPLSLAFYCLKQNHKFNIQQGILLYFQWSLSLWRRPPVALQNPICPSIWIYNQNKFPLSLAVMGGPRTMFSPVNVSHTDLLDFQVRFIKSSHCWLMGSWCSRWFWNAMLMMAEQPSAWVPGWLKRISAFPSRTPTMTISWERNKLFSLNH